MTAGGAANVTADRPTSVATPTGAESAGTKAGVRRDASARLAAWTFAVVVAGAVPVILYQGRDQWFFADEWDFLTRRSAGSFHDLIAPHGQHWTTFGILVYRGLWWLVGLRHYWPYQLCGLTFHLTAAVLLRAVMLRARVNPWIATAAASLFALFGAGRTDIVFGFQLTFTGALAFGLAHLLLADRDGAFGRVDLIGIAFGLLALMCSGVGVTMALAVGTATFVRRGWRIALMHTAPLAAAFLLWSATFGRNAYRDTSVSAADAVTFTRDMFVAVFNGIGQLPAVGVVAVLVVLVGVPLALTTQTWSEFRRCDGPTVGLALAAVSFAFATGYARASDTADHIGRHTQPSEPRYLHIVAALLLPTIALAASAFVDRWRLALPAAISLFVVGVPGNVAALHASGDQTTTLGYPDLVLTMARLPLAHEVPRDLRPGPPPNFPISWLLDGVASGRVPEPAHVNPATIAVAELYLSVYQTTDIPNSACVPIQSGAPVNVHAGDVIKINGESLILHRRIDGQFIAQSTYSRTDGRALKIVGVPLQLVIRTTPSDTPAELCR